MKQFLFAVFLSMLIFDEVFIKASMGQPTFQTVIEQFAEKVKPLLAAKKVEAEAALNQIIATHGRVNMAFYDAQKKLYKARSEARRDWVQELKELFVPYPSDTPEVESALQPFSIPAEVETHVRNLANAMNARHKHVTDRLINEIWSTQAAMNQVCDRLLLKLRSDTGVTSNLPSAIIYDNWQSESLTDELLGIIKYNKPIMKRKNTVWRNKFDKEVEKINNAKQAFATETNSLIQKLNTDDPNQIKGILRDYKKFQKSFRDILDKTDRIVNEYYGLRNAFIDILMGDRTNCDLFRRAAEKETIQLLD